MDAFDRIIGYEEIKAELRRYCDILKHYEKYEKFGVKAPNGLIISGEPGIGKTTLINCFMDEVGWKRYIIRKNMPDDKFIEYIGNVFDKAMSDEKAIIFLDDMDKFSNNDYDHRDTIEYATIQTCIDKCNGYDNIFVIATVNDRRKISPSLLRSGRFDLSIKLYRPSYEDVKKIVKYYLSISNNIGDVDIDEIVDLLNGDTCAELENVINEAGIYAAYNNKSKIENEDIVEAFLQSKYFKNYDKNVSDDYDLDGMAIHEAGHVAVAEMLYPRSVIYTTLYNDRETYGGVTQRINKDFKNRIYKELFENRIIIALAGKAANEVLRGKGDTGAREDIAGALLNLESLTKAGCYGFDCVGLDIDRSNYMKDNAERIRAYEMNRLYNEAKKIVVDNKIFIERVAAELLEKKVLMRRDIQRIKSECFSV